MKTQTEATKHTTVPLAFVRSHANLFSACDVARRYIEACTDHGRWNDIDWEAILTQMRAAVSQADNLLAQPTHEALSLVKAIADNPYTLTPDQWASEAREALQSVADDYEDRGCDGCGTISALTHQKVVAAIARAEGKAI